MVHKYMMAYVIYEIVRSSTETFRCLAPKGASTCCTASPLVQMKNNHANGFVYIYRNLAYNCNVFIDVVSTCSFIYVEATPIQYLVAGCTCSSFRVGRRGAFNQYIICSSASTLQGSAQVHLGSFNKSIQKLSSII